MRNHRQVEAARQLGLVNAGSNTLYFLSIIFTASTLYFSTKNNHHKRGLLYPLNPINPLFGDDHYALLPEGLVVTGLVSGDKSKVVMKLF